MMTTSSSSPGGPKAKSGSLADVKLLITVVGVVSTVGGWAALSHQDSQVSAQPSGPVAVTAESAQIGRTAGSPAAPDAGVSRPTVGTSSTGLRSVVVPPPAARPPRPVATTRSSR
ncbi:MAG: hypothetical protein HY329_15070 [Chloroflexi bacterium]|nr:hypothetical protein [Chloroflexota bacterium]